MRERVHILIGTGIGQIRYLNRMHPPTVHPAPPPSHPHPSLPSAQHSAAHRPTLQSYKTHAFARQRQPPAPTRLARPHPLHRPPGERGPRARAPHHKAPHRLFRLPPQRHFRQPARVPPRSLPVSSLPKPALNTILDLEAKLDPERAANLDADARLRSLTDAWADLGCFLQHAELRAPDACASFAHDGAAKLSTAQRLALPPLPLPPLPLLPLPLPPPTAPSNAGTITSRPTISIASIASVAPSAEPASARATTPQTTLGHPLSGIAALDITTSVFPSCIFLLLSAHLSLPTDLSPTAKPLPPPSLLLTNPLRTHSPQPSTALHPAPLYPRPFH